jgi:hypothetical protein
LWGGCGFQLFVDLVYALPGGGEFRGLGEGFAEAGGGVVDLAAGVAGVGEGTRPDRFESGEPVFQAGDQTNGVGGGEILPGEGHLGAVGAV